MPVAVRVRGDGFLVALPWGSGTNWVRNVRAAGGCVVRWRGVDHRCVDPVIVDRVGARPFFGRVTWFVVRRVIGADAFLHLRRVA